MFQIKPSKKKREFLIRELTVNSRQHHADEAFHAQFFSFLWVFWAANFLSVGKLRHGLSVAQRKTLNWSFELFRKPSYFDHLTGLVYRQFCWFSYGNRIQSTAEGFGVAGAWYKRWFHWDFFLWSCCWTWSPILSYFTICHWLSA